MREIKMELGERSYNITIGKGLLRRACDYFKLDRAALIVTDDNIPPIYAESVAGCAKRAEIYTIREGEGSKNINTLSALVEKMTEMKLTRSDCVIAVGGGVVGDLTGLAASLYMRGIDFYNVPTSLLAMVDSSIGGKTAINHAGIKNIVGAFYQPRGVLIDTDVLATLPERHIAAGLCEAIKMAATSDEELFEYLENTDTAEIILNPEDMIERALNIKKRVVEQDERESGLRKILNFGHTLGHGIEASSGEGVLYHGECVALGMLPMCSPRVRERLIPTLKRHRLPTEYNGDIEAAIALAMHDKKANARGIDIITVDRIGECEIRTVSAEEFAGICLGYYGK
jgi:3-dehydroquinate synthase